MLDPRDVPIGRPVIGHQLGCRGYRAQNKGVDLGFAADRSLWLDEAKLALNLINRSFRPELTNGRFLWHKPTNRERISAAAVFTEHFLTFLCLVPTEYY